MPVERVLPILSHALDETSAFTAEALIESVRHIRSVPPGPVPALCILEFDGDLTDWLVAQGLATPFASWPCFHTTMFSVELEGLLCGVIPRTIGGPYAVLIAEQLAAAGCELILGLTSAGRVAPDLPLPCLVIVTSAIRDEGTSLHYLPPGKSVACPVSAIISLFEGELSNSGWAVRSGSVWTTDAPYRETTTQLTRWAADSVLAVEMQAASLFAFGAAKGVPVAYVAMVSNAVDHEGEQFDTGSGQDGLTIITGCARGFKRWRSALQKK